jgi:hypothetical protein
VKLSQSQKSRIKFHLGYTDTTSQGDIYWADRQLSRPYEEQIIRLIKANLDGLDETYGLLTAIDNVTKTESIIGDVNRTITNTEVDPARLRKRYVAQGDLLAESLGIANNRGKDKNQERRGDSGLINYLYRPDGSSVGSRLMMSDSWS